MKATDLPRMPGFRNNGAVYQVCGSLTDVGCRQHINTNTTNHVIVRLDTGQEVFLHLVPCYRFLSEKHTIVKEVITNKMT